MNIYRNQYAHFFILLFIWILEISLVNPIGEFPLNDDWAYAYSVQELVENGVFRLSGWTATNYFSQIGWGALFCLPAGFSFTALRISTLVAGFGGLWATYLMVRLLSDDRRFAFWAALCMAVNPIYLSMSNSFMTDIPFYTSALLACYFFISGLQRDNNRLLLAGLALAFFALLIRQLGIALFVGFGVGYVLKRGVNIVNLGIALVIIGASVFTQLTFQYAINRLFPGQMIYYNVQSNTVVNRLLHPNLQFFRDLLFHFFMGIVYMGMIMAPFLYGLLGTSAGQRIRKKAWLFVVCAVALAGLWLLFMPNQLMTFWGNILNQAGLGPLTLRDTYYNITQISIPPFFKVIQIIFTTSCFVSGTLVLYYLIDFVIQSIRIPNRVASWSTVVVLIVLCIYCVPVFVLGFFDRYLLFVAPLLIILFLVSSKNQPQARSYSRLLGWLSYTTLAVYMLFSIAVTHDYLSWNRTRWDALRELEGKGITAERIDGGLEYNAWRLFNKQYLTYKRSEDRSWWWVIKDDYIVSMEGISGCKVIKQYNVNTWLPFGITKITVNECLN